MDSILMTKLSLTLFYNFITCSHVETHLSMYPLTVILVQALRPVLCLSVSPPQCSCLCNSIKKIPQATNEQMKGGLLCAKRIIIFAWGKAVCPSRVSQTGSMKMLILGVMQGPLNNAPLITFGSDLKEYLSLSFLFNPIVESPSCSF